MNEILVAAYLSAQNCLGTKMKVTVATLTDYIFVLDVSPDLELENFKAFCEVESGFPASEIVIAFNGRPLMDNKKSLKDHGVRDGDAVILQHMLQHGSSTSIDQGRRKSFRSGVDASRLDFFVLTFVDVYF